MNLIDLHENVSNGGSVAKDLVGLSPPIAISGITFLGIALSDWVYIGTMVYTIVGIITLIKKHWVDPYLAARRVRENERKRRASESDSGSDA